MAGKNGARWKHGWVPQNVPAAMLKAHGRRAGAMNIIGSPGVNKHKASSAKPAVPRQYAKRASTASRPRTSLLAKIPRSK